MLCHVGFRDWRCCDGIKNTNKNKFKLETFAWSASQCKSNSQNVSVLYLLVQFLKGCVEWDQESKLYDKRWLQIQEHFQMLALLDTEKAEVHKRLPNLIYRFSKMECRADGFIGKILLKICRFMLKIDVSFFKETTGQSAQLNEGRPKG